MQRYRIYTEQKPNLTKLANKHLEGFTIFKGIGAWKNKLEKSAVIETLATNKQQVNKLAIDIKKVNKQEAVYITSERIKATLY